MKNSSPGLTSRKRRRRLVYRCNKCDKILGCSSSLYSHKRSLHSLFPMKTPKIKKIVANLMGKSVFKYSEEKAALFRGKNLCQLTELYIRNKILYRSKVLSTEDESSGVYSGSETGLAKRELIYCRGPVLEALMRVFKPMKEDCILANLSQESLLSMVLEPKPEYSLAEALAEQSEEAEEIFNQTTGENPDLLVNILLNFSLTLTSQLNCETATRKITAVMVLFSEYLSEFAHSEELNRNFLVLRGTNPCEDFHFCSVRSLLVQDLMRHFLETFALENTEFVSFVVISQVLELFQRWLEINAQADFKLYF